MPSSPVDTRKRDLIVAWLRDMGISSGDFTPEGLADNLLTFLYRHNAGVYIAGPRAKTDDVRYSEPTSAPNGNLVETPRSPHSAEWFNDRAMSEDYSATAKDG